ncbi:hypothetical protein CRE_15749 [Caenorhabditis remanei]|uniref:Uncharacterized protein n=1 Tax=Caenorhabditis remanei TaxID=31234 RepID=E3NIT4_CAERE|nr:hypothetical protein CRE_15749 [Caenorhabditis remanei]
MCNVYITCIDSYKELSELKKLTYLDISKTESSPNDRYNPFCKIIDKLLISDVLMDQLKCIDCSCTIVTRFQLLRFAERHPNLKTIVAMENTNEPTEVPNVNLLNFCETGDILKSLHYSISNRKSIFIRICLQELKSILRFNFNDMSRSELADSMKVMLYIMETHYIDSWTRDNAVGVLSLMFQTENLGKWSFLQIEIVLRRLFKQVNAMKRTMHMHLIQNLFGIVESIMNAVTARQQIPDALLSVIFLNITKAFTIAPGMCLFYLPVLTKLQTETMNWEQQCMSDDVKYVIAVFGMVDNVFAEKEYRHYGGCLKILQFILEKSEKSRKYVIEKGLHLKLIEHYNVFEGIGSPLRLEVLKILTFDLLISFC